MEEKISWNKFTTDMLTFIILGITTIIGYISIINYFKEGYIWQIIIMITMAFGICLQLYKIGFKRSESEWT